MAIENYRLLKARAEAAAAREIQLALLPRHPPDIPGYTFWSHYEPALEVGGDYYDYIPVTPAGAGTGDNDGARDAPLSEGCWTIAVGDVMGKGMPAALVMAHLGAEMRHQARAESDPRRIVERINRHFCEDDLMNLFITLVVTVIDPTTHRLTVVRAGHPGPLRRRSGGEVAAVGEEERGMPLAVMANREYRASTISLEPGDVVVLYSDGICDAMNRHGQPFGTPAMMEALASAQPGAAAAGTAILDAVRRHIGKTARSDDMTLICFGRD
jgi:serine phosphatase RsbU (regulator of sigma subunit)